ncbi:MAG TPA: chemotaxis protein CheW [Longimicrobiales bacterium]
MSSTRRAAGAAPAWMLIDVAGARFALAIDAVGEVLPVPELAPVPMTPDWMAGIADVRGEVVPVVDVGLRLRREPASRAGRIVLTRPDESGERVGLIVDAIAGLVEQGADPGAPHLDVAALLDPAVDLSI